MNLSFLPGELHLNKTVAGDYVIKIQGEEVFTTQNEKKAITKFNALRKEMEAKFPPHEITPEEKKAILQRMIMHQMMGEVRKRYGIARKEEEQDEDIRMNLCGLFVIRRTTSFTSATSGASQKTSQGIRAG